MRSLVLALTLAGCSAAAQTSTSSPASKPPITIKVTQADAKPDVDPAHQASPEQIREYFALTHLDVTMKGIMSQMLTAMKTTAAPYIPDDVWKDMDAAMTSFDFLSELVPIYQKHLSRDDLQGILAFYRTDAGKHLLDNQTVMGNEAQAAFRTIGRRIGEEVGERHSAEIVAAKKKYEDDISNKQSIHLTPDPPSDHR